MGRFQEARNADGSIPLVAVAIDRDKGSQVALKWAVESLVGRGQTLVLVHVNAKGGVSGPEDSAGFRQPTDPQMKELFLPFRCFCTRKDIKCKDIVLDDADICKAILEFVAYAAIDVLVLGMHSKGSFVRKFRNSDLPTNLSKGAPDFCTVYVISKGKVSSMRNAVRPAPSVSPLKDQIQSNLILKQPESGAGTPTLTPTHWQDMSIKSPFSRSGRVRIGPSSVNLISPDSTDISFVSSSSRPSMDRSPFTPRLSSGSESINYSFETRTPHSIGKEMSSFSQSSTGTWSSMSSQTMEDVEAEMRRLRLELKQTMDMYSNACKEAITAQQKALELNHWKVEEEQRVEEARLAEQAALSLVEREKLKCRVAMEAAEASRRIAEIEAQKRINAERQLLEAAEEKEKVVACALPEIRYRRYTIEEIEIATEYFAEHHKIGEGGYGPVFRGHLDHTSVAIKVLRPDAAQGRQQFQQEVEILSCIRHPNMVLLLGACPEYGCLVYEYMANGSLEDRLFRRGNTPVIPWQHRFRIAAEISTGLLFLHQTKPEPLVHRDLKPANILLDRSYSSKISDVGLARLIPPSVADSVTQYRMTATAGTFCYIDPEYQQTGMLGVKSDIYSLGVMLLQLITAKPPMGLTHYVSRSIEKGTFAEMLDPAVPDWPMDEVRSFAEMALQCAELRRKDRPDLATVVLPELNRLRAIGEEKMELCLFNPASHRSPNASSTSHSMHNDARSDPVYRQSIYNSMARSGESAAEHGRRSNVL